MTAIASAFTSEGFVIGADSRQLGKGNTIFSEASQKIFNFNYRHVDAAYAWCGETKAINESNQVLYDLYEITRAALTSAGQAGRIPFPSFIQQCCDGRPIKQSVTGRMSFLQTFSSISTPSFQSPSL
jgi:hypothetical protein